MFLATILAGTIGVAVVPARAEGTLTPDLVRAAQTGVPGPDRLRHASLALTLGLGAGILTEEPAAAALVPALLGLGKEIVDRRRDRFDTLDLAADLAGAVLAAVLTAQLSR